MTTELRDFGIIPYAQREDLDLEAKYPLTRELLKYVNDEIATKRSKGVRGNALEEAYKEAMWAAIEWKLNSGVDVATKLLLELKSSEYVVAGKRYRSPFGEQIADIFFGAILIPALTFWLREYLRKIGMLYLLSRDDLQDMMAAALLRILIVDYELSLSVLGWASVVAHQAWVDYMRKEARRWMQGLKAGAYDMDEERSVDLTILPISADMKEILLRPAKKREDKQVMEAVFEGIPWEKTIDIAEWTGLSKYTVTKSKERIKKVANRSGIRALL